MTPAALMVVTAPGTWWAVAAEAVSSVVAEEGWPGDDPVDAASVWGVDPDPAAKRARLLLLGPTDEEAVPVRVLGRIALQPIEPDQLQPLPRHLLPSKVGRAFAGVVFPDAEDPGRVAILVVDPSCAREHAR